MRIAPIQNYGLCHSKNGLQTMKNFTMQTPMSKEFAQDFVACKSILGLKDQGLVLDLKL